MLRYIDMENWDRREYYEHYMHAVRCSYSMTVNLDITERLAAIKGQGALYPVMLYFLSVLVNRHEEFRYAVKAGRVGVYDSLHPSYTIFHKESETFSCIWTRFEEEFAAFHRAYLCDKEAYGQAAGLVPKPDCPENSFDISCIPWTSFSGFNLNVPCTNFHDWEIFHPGGCGASTAGASTPPRRVRRIPCMPSDKRAAGAVPKHERITYLTINLHILGNKL